MDSGIKREYRLRIIAISCSVISAVTVLGAIISVFLLLSQVHKSYADLYMKANFHIEKLLGKSWRLSIPKVNTQSKWLSNSANGSYEFSKFESNSGNQDNNNINRILPLFKRTITHSNEISAETVETKYYPSLVKIECDKTKPLCLRLLTVFESQDYDGCYGPKGFPGLPGLPGDSGLDGKDGLPGLPGKDAPEDDDNIAGSAGSKGEKGEPGEKGWPGEIGRKGKDAKPKLQGEKGMPGLPGPQGQDGDSGNDGAPGIVTTVYEFGPKGPQGEKGSKGPVGLDGAVGDDGPVGQKGDPGDPGPKGPIGQIALTGMPGPPGDKGDPGICDKSCKLREYTK